jgi:type IX secretion system PorP/SprF family membrane protein
MKKFLLRYCLLFGYLGCSIVCSGQDQPVFSQFTLNPFQFNPSYAASNGYLEANIFYRKQWINIENAPSVGSFNIQAPVGRNVSLGLNLVTNKTILLSTNSALATFAYRVRMGTYHHLDFGISSGLAMNNFDLEATANDPFFSNVVPRSQYLTGQFGFNYRYKNFHMGFALPNLFDSRPNSLREFQDINFNAFKNKFGSIGYNFNRGQVQISPLVIYRALDNRQDQWEGMVMATYRGFIWVGASYRDGYGLTGIVGFRLKGSYRVSYAYEYPTTEIRDASAGSHEFYLGARLGKRDREEQFAMEDLKKDSLDQVAKAKKELEATQKQEQEKLLAEAKKQEQEKLLAEAKQKEQEKLTEKPEEKTEVKPIEQPVIVVTKPEVKPTQVKENTVDEVPSDYYVVLGAYKSQQNALSQMRALRDQGLMPQMHYRVDKQYYYVYLLKTDNRKQALEELTKERERNRFQGVWLYAVPKR